MPALREAAILPETVAHFQALGAGHAATVVCAAFTTQGGTAIQWKMGTNDISEVTKRLRQWLDEGPGTVPAPAVYSVPAAS